MNNLHTIQQKTKKKREALIRISQFLQAPSA